MFLVRHTEALFFVNDDEAEFLEQIEVADGGKTASTGLSGAMPRELAIEMP